MHGHLNVKLWQIVCEKKNNNFNIPTFIGFIVWNLYWGTGKNNFKINTEFCKHIFLHTLNEELRYET